MATVCRCGAGIVWAQTAQGERLSLNSVASLGGEERYRVVSFDDPWLVERVTATAQVAAYEDHRRSCSKA